MPTPPMFRKPNEYGNTAGALDALIGEYLRAKESQKQMGVQSSMQKMQLAQQGIDPSGFDPSDPNSIAAITEQFLKQKKTKSAQEAEMMAQKEAESYASRRKDMAQATKTEKETELLGKTKTPEAPKPLSPTERAQIEGGIMDDYLKSSTFTNLSAAKTSLRDLASIQKNKSGAGDIAAIYSFIKTMDPNAVKEGEVSMTQSALPGLDRIKIIYDSMKSGNKITPEMKRELMTVAKGMYDAKLKSADEFRAPLIARAKQYQINPDIAVPSLAIPESELSAMFGEEPGGVEEVQLKDAKGNVRIGLYQGSKFLRFK